MFEVTKVPGAVRYRYVGDGPPTAAATLPAKRVADLPSREYERSRARLLADDPDWHVPESLPTNNIRDMSEAEYQQHKAALLAECDAQAMAGMLGTRAGAQGATERPGTNAMADASKAAGNYAAGTRISFRPRDTRC